jgi:hypothetical protein
MTRKTTRNYSLSVVAPFFAVLTLLIAAAVLAQVTGADRPSGTANAVLTSAGDPSPAQAERTVPQSTNGAGHFLVGHAQTKRYGTSSMDSNPPLFLRAVAYGAGGWDAYSGAVADVNGDGKPDVVVANFGTGIGVLLGNGNGTFQSALTTGAGSSPHSVAVGDFNGDGKPDLVVANYINGGGRLGSVSVLLGNGDGTFQLAGAYDSGGHFAISVAVADVNCDGRPDLVVANCNPSGGDSCAGVGVVGVLLGNGGGTFQPVATYSSGGNGAWAVAVADVNGDGEPDLVVANSDGSDTVGVLLGNGDGTFQPAAVYDSGGQSPMSVAVADVNGDGKPDLVLANLWSHTVGVLRGKGDGTFQPAVTYEVGAPSWSVAIADVTGDGKLDVLVATYNGNSVGVLPGNGDGTFQAAHTYQSGGRYAMAVIATDVNDDGKPDLVVVNEWANNNYYSDGVVSVLLHSTTEATRAVVATSGSPSFIGQPVTFTATVTAAYGTIPDGQLVTFHDGTTTLGSVALTGGTAAFTTSSLSAKTHSIKAAYTGDANFKPSSGRVTQVVAKFPTTTALTSSPNPSAHGQRIIFTATVAPGGPYSPTGRVKFLDGTIGIGSALLNGGVAKLTKSTLAVGTHAITAQYLGDAASAKSTSSVLDQVVQ